MSEVSLAVEPTRATGSAASRRLRATGKVPAVIYGHGVQSIAVAVDRRELRAALAGAGGSNTLINLDVAGSRHLAMARQIQRDPIRNVVSHVDFLVVDRDEMVGAEVPIHMVGESLVVNRAGGFVDQQLLVLPVHARPADIPAAIEVDVSDLDVGDTVRVSDLEIPDGVRVDAEAEETVLVALAAYGEEPEAEVAEATEE